MLSIGLSGLALVLTGLIVAALKKGGKTLKPQVAYGLGGVLAYTYANTGAPWNLLAGQATDLTGSASAQFNAGSAAIAIAGFAIWFYWRPGVVGSTLMGFLTITAAAGATDSDVLTMVMQLLGTLVGVVAG